MIDASELAAMHELWEAAKASRIESILFGPIEWREIHVCFAALAATLNEEIRAVYMQQLMEAEET